MPPLPQDRFLPSPPSQLCVACSFGGLFIQRAAPPPPTPVPSPLQVSSSKCPLPVEAPSTSGSGYTDRHHPDCWVCWAKAIARGEAAAAPLGREEGAGDGRAGAGAHLGHRGVRPNRPCRCTARVPRRRRSHSRERSHTGHTGDPASQAGTCQGSVGRKMGTREWGGDKGGEGVSVAFCVRLRALGGVSAQWAGEPQKPTPVT